MRSLSDIQIGESYQVIHLNRCSRLHRKRLMAMGFVPGAIFETLRFAPLGDPIEIKIKGYSLALRRQELLEICFIPKTYQSPQIKVQAS